MNKIRHCLPLVAVLFLAAGCSTPTSRIQRNQAAFNSWPADVQREVSAGRVGMGFTPQMVEVALGKPDSVFTSVSTTGGPVETWAYFDHSPSWSIGVGVGGSNGSTAIGTSVGVGSQNWGPNETMRIIFESGRVAVIQQRQK